MKSSGAQTFERGSAGWEGVALNANSDWIKDRHSDGCKLIDIGHDTVENRSSFYAIEKQTLSSIGAKVYKGSSKAVTAARQKSKDSSRPRSNVLCAL